MHAFISLPASRKLLHGRSLSQRRGAEAGAGAQYRRPLGVDIASRSDTSTTPQTLGHCTNKRIPITYLVFPVTRNHILGKGVIRMKTGSGSDYATENADLKPSKMAL